MNWHNARMPDSRRADSQRREEHTDPHLVAGFGDPRELEPDLRPDGRGICGADRVARSAVGPRPGCCAKPVWHCSVRAAPEDRMLSDAEWGQVAGRDHGPDRVAPEGDDSGVRWVAVRHAPDHIHIVATLARQDGGRVKTWNDFYRVREACQDAEAPVRAAVHGSGGPHRRQAARPRRDGAGGPARMERGAPRDPAPGRVHRGGRGEHGTGVLRPAGASRGPRAQAVQHDQPRRGHRIRGRPAGPHHQGRRDRLVRRREARRRPHAAEAAGPLGRASRGSTSGSRCTA